MKKIRIHPVKAIRKKLTAIDADPQKIMYGFAFGVFMATTPLIGIKWLVALPIVMLAKWSKAACLIGILQINYLTGPLFYSLAYITGKTVCGYSNMVELPSRLNFSAFIDIFFRNTEVFISLLAGGLVLSVPLTIGAYYLARSLFSQKLNTQMS